MNVSNPTEMVACDQLFRAALQLQSTAIADKQNEFTNVICAKGYNVSSALNCDICQLKDTCTAKTQIDTLKQELTSLTDEKLQLMNKYSELQDTIKSYLLS
jgi:hypothetical protein